MSKYNLFSGEMKQSAAHILEILQKYRYLVIILLAGLVLMGVGGDSDKAADEKQKPEIGEAQQQTEEFSLEQFQRDLCAQLSRIDGAGRVELMLSLRATEESVYASDVRQMGDGDATRSYEKSLSVISNGSYGESPVQIKRTCPTFRGAVILCDGAENLKVRLAITEAVSAVCDIGTDKIAVLKMDTDLQEGK